MEGKRTVTLWWIFCRHGGLLLQMTLRQMEQRYRGSLMGIAWCLIQPLLMLCVYTFVFSEIFNARWHVSTEDGHASFAVIMFCGMSLYSIFSESVVGSCGIVSGNPNFVKKVIFPLEVLPLSNVLSVFALGLAWILLLFAGTFLILGFIGWTMLLLPLVLMPLFVFTLGVSYFVASLGVYIRDTQYVVGVLMQILFFATPIFYPVSAVPERYRWVLEWNPLTIIIEQARNVFLYGKLPDWQFLAFAMLIAVVVLKLGLFFFGHTKKGFSDVL